VVYVAELYQRLFRRALTQNNYAALRHTLDYHMMFRMAVTNMAVDAADWQNNYAALRHTLDNHMMFRMAVTNMAVDAADWPSGCATPATPASASPHVTSPALSVASMFFDKWSQITMAHSMPESFGPSSCRISAHMCRSIQGDTHPLSPRMWS